MESGTHNRQRGGVNPERPDHYATLGLGRRCTEEQIRSAYRRLAKAHHPDVNQDAHDAMARTQALNAAYEVLGDLSQRRAYDEELARAEGSTTGMRTVQNLNKDVHIGIEELLRGATLTVTVNDPANPEGPESYELIVPAETAPGTRFRLQRAAPFARSFVVVRVKMRPDFRFKARGADLRCDMKVSAQRAEQGGTATVRGATGNTLTVRIPVNVARNAIVKIPGEGLPRPRGGRGDLLVRITYRPEIRIARRG